MAFLVEMTHLKVLGHLFSFLIKRVLLNIGVVSNETNTDVRMYNLILLDDLHYSMYK